jgi:cysteine-rich repeat protein
VVALAATATGCIDSYLLGCDNGLACPASERCDEVHRSCVLPEQLLVCAGIIDGTDCAAGPISGRCFDRVCLPRGCGNRVVEPGETCDDGNQVSGDGCSGDCRSTEQCGNGFVDPGEPCDDGNLQSLDGCDSRCNAEGTMWSPVIAIAPRTIDAQYTAYDVARGRLVYAISGGTWEWDGTRWTFIPPPEFLAFTFEGVFYDPDLARVCVVGTDYMTSVARRYCWTDGSWVSADSTDGPALFGFPTQIAVIYDTTRHRLMMVETATGAVWTIDAAGSWVELPSMPGIPGESAAVFDPVSSHVVLETTASVEWIYDGMTWTSSSTRFGSRVSLAFDPMRGHVVLVDNAARTLSERNGDAWTPVDDAQVPCGNELMSSTLALYYDPRVGALSLFASGGELCQWDQGWTVASTQPFNPIGVTYDPTSHGFVVFHNPHPQDPASPTETWRLGDDGWQRIETRDTPYGRASSLAVYVPDRKATVLYGEQLAPDDGDPTTKPCGEPTDYNADTWSFDGATWSLLTSSVRRGPPCSRNAVTYDATHGRVVLATENEVWTLGDTDDTWQHLAAPSSKAPVFQLAWDARNSSLIALRLTADATPLFELRSEAWVPIKVVPVGLQANSTTLISDLRAGTMIVIESSDGGVWERAGAEWRPLPRPPLSNAFVSWAAYDPSRGRILYIGRNDTGTFAAILARTSVSPVESCRAGEDADADGDGLAGCLDPDCAWDCP